MEVKQRKNWMRNKPCMLCPSGKKFKNCCWGKAIAGIRVLESTPKQGSVQGTTNPEEGAKNDGTT